MNMSLPPAAPEQQPDVVYYTVRSPWAWVMKEVASASPLNMQYVDTPTKLPSGSLAQNITITATPNTARRRSIVKKGPTPCTLKLELVNKKNNKNNKNTLLYALHGTSAALDGLEDKDELVRTMQRCRSEHLNIGPPSILIKWDITREELGNYVPQLPVLPNHVHDIAVLKEPMGSRGEGIYFVKSADEAFAQIDRHRVQALGEPDLLDNIMVQKGRMPAWVLQAEVHPPKLVQGGRKFHIRSNIAVVEKLWHDDYLDIYIHNRHEVRIAGIPVENDNNNNDDNDDNDTRLEGNNNNNNNRNPLAHITNGASSDSTERTLLTAVPELSSYQDELEVFLAKAMQSFMADIIRRVGYSASQETLLPKNVDIRKFAIAGVDIMMTDEGRFYVLEFNVNPAAPPEEVTSPAFKEHLVGWMTDLCDLIMGKPSPNFIDIRDIIR